MKNFAFHQLLRFSASDVRAVNEGNYEVDVKFKVS